MAEVGKWKFVDVQPDPAGGWQIVTAKLRIPLGRLTFDEAGLIGEPATQLDKAKAEELAGRLDAWINLNEGIAAKRRDKKSHS